MGCWLLLQRATSAAEEDWKTHRKQADKMAESDEKMGEMDDDTASSEDASKPTSQDRPLTSDGGRSFSRPRTVSAAIERPADLSRPKTAGAAVERVGETQVPEVIMEVSAGNEIFSFPMPSPRVLPPKSPSSRTSPSKLGGLESPAIGVAIGSPSSSKPRWSPPLTADQISKELHNRPLPPLPSQQDDPDVDTDIPAELRKKKSSWKTLGSLFGRKISKRGAEEPFYKLKLAPRRSDPSSHAPAAERDMHTVDTPPRLTKNPSKTHHRRNSSITRGIARFEARAEADWASFMPGDQPTMLRTPSAIQKEGHVPMFQSLAPISDEVKDENDEPRADSPLSVKEKTEERILQRWAPPKGPHMHLDVDLPDTQFERYSVMFEGVLDESKPSLLERRQSKLKRKPSIKKLDLTPPDKGQQDTVHLKPPNTLPRRYSSLPGAKRWLSTRFDQTVLSPVKETFSALHRPRPIQRSKTLSPTAESPSTQTFSKPTIAVEGCSPTRGTERDASLPPTPLTWTTISDGGSTSFVDNNLSTVQRDLDEAEPSWDMVTSEVAKLSPGPSPNPQSETESPGDLENDVVQVSVAKQVPIARQFSVGRAMQQMRHSITVRRPKVVEEPLHRASTLVIVETIGETIEE